MREEREMIWWLKWEKIWILVRRLPKFLLPKSGYPDEVPKEEKCLKGKKQLWQPSCWNCRGGKRREKKGIVATKLPKIGEKEKNCGNQVAEIGAENWRKKKRNCGSQVAEIEKEKKKREKLICGNGIVENGRGEKKNCGNGVAKNWKGERERERESS